MTQELETMRKAMIIHHYALAANLYSTGLRIGELVYMKISDIGSKNMLLHVRQG